MGRNIDENRIKEKQDKITTAFGRGLALGMITMLIIGGFVYFKMKNIIDENNDIMLYGDNCIYVNPPRQLMEVVDNEKNETIMGMCSRRFNPYLDCRFDIDPVVYNKQFIEGNMIV